MSDVSVSLRDLAELREAGQLLAESLGSLTSMMLQQKYNARMEAQQKPGGIGGGNYPSGEEATLRSLIENTLPAAKKLLRSDIARAMDAIGRP